MSKSSNKMEDGTILNFIGGNNEKKIGQNSLMIEHTENNETKRIMFDLGALFPPEWTGLDAIIPDVRRYFAHSIDGKEIPAKEPVEAVFLSHCHEDHIGGLVHLARAGFKFPKIYTSKYTAELLKIALKEAEASPDCLDVQIVEMGKNIKISDNMEVSPFNVSHSTVGALGFYVKTTLNNDLCAGIINPGDYNLGDSLIGEGFDEKKFAEFLADKPVTHALLDSTSSDNSDDYLVTFEEAVTNTLEQLNNHKEKQVISAVISRSLQNLAIDLEVAKRSGRKVFIDGYWTKLAYIALQKCGFRQYDDVVYGSDDLLHACASIYVQKYPPEKRYIIPSGAFAESARGHKSGLYKMSMQQKATKNSKGKTTKKGSGGHSDFIIDSNTLILARQRCIEDINGIQVREMYQRLAALGATIIENLSSNPIGCYAAALMQRTGHAVKSETIKFIKIINKYRKNIDKMFFIPFHGNREQLNNTAKTIIEARAEPAICYNAEKIKVSVGNAKKIDSTQQCNMQYIAVREDSFGQKLSAFFYTLIDDAYNKIADLFEVRPDYKLETNRHEYDKFSIEEYEDMPFKESKKEMRISREKNSRHSDENSESPDNNKSRNTGKKFSRKIANIIRSKIDTIFK